MPDPSAFLVRSDEERDAEAVFCRFTLEKGNGFSDLERVVGIPSENLYVAE